MSKYILAALWLAGIAGEPMNTIDCGNLQVGFDGVSGRWTWLGVRGGPNLLGGPEAPDIEVALEGAQWPEGWVAENPRVTGAGDAREVTVRRRAGDWAVSATYSVSGTTLLRTVRLSYSGAEPVRVRGVLLRVPGIRLDGAEDAVWSLPGNYPVVESRFGDNSPGRETRERGWTWSETGMAYARSPSAGVSVLSNYSLRLDGAVVQVQEAEGAVSLVHRFGTTATLGAGDEIEVGTQLVHVAEGDLEGLRRAGRELALAANPGPPADRPQWLSGAVLSELHPWGRLWAWGAGDRGSRMSSLEAQLPYLRDLGVDAIWLLPVSEKPPWVYHLPAFRKIDEQVTTAEQLRSFISTGHGLGMRVLMDLVTYGISPDSPDVASLPESVWCVNEQGERAKAWSDTVLAADCSEPDWRAHIVDLTSWWVREFGADGFRLDCGGCGQSLNHRPRTSLHANAGMLAGGVEQNRLIRQAIRRINPDAVLLPEAGAPAHFTSGDMIFDYPLYMVCREMTREPDRATWVGHLRDFLVNQQMTHSPGAIDALVRFTENHDTVAAPEFFGIGPSQALTALQAFLPGVLLLYQEQEIGFGPELRQWLRLRHELPELRSGAADYQRVTCGDPCVLAFTRETEGRLSVVAVNFGDSLARCRLVLPGEATPPVAQDGFTGETVDLRGPVVIPPYRPRVFTLQSGAALAEPPQRAAAATGAPQVQETVEELPDGGVRYTLRPEPCAQWFVKTGEGLATDEFVNRHRSVKAGETHVDATLPLAHLWRPLENGLWDGPGEMSLGTLSADGSMMEVCVGDVGALRRARIEDPSAEGRAVALVLEAREGRRPFEVRRHRDGRARLEELLLRPAASEKAGLRVDPLWVRFSNEHCGVAFSRRHGGAMTGLWRAGDGRSLLRPGAEVYTDWGLYEKGRHVSADWETNPRLSVEQSTDGARVTFRGRLRIPSWNGVQTGPPAGPAVDYRLTYELGQAASVGVTFAATPTSDRPDTSAFLAYRLPLALVDHWRATTEAGTLGGRTGDRRGERVYEALGAGDMSSIQIRLSGSAGDIVLDGIRGEPGPPDNPFLLDEGPGRIQWFFALLAGTQTDLAAGRELSGRFDLKLQ